MFVSAVWLSRRTLEAARMCTGGQNLVPSCVEESELDDNGKPAFIY